MIAHDRSKKSSDKQVCQINFLDGRSAVVELPIDVVNRILAYLANPNPKAVPEGEITDTSSINTAINVISLVILILAASSCMVFAFRT